MIFNLKIIHSIFLLLALLCISTIVCNAQKNSAYLVNIGDNAPHMRLCKWLKGTPIYRFEKGKVYVLEFWATWCVPCKAAMPRLSALSNKYNDSITVLGIDVYENQNMSIEKIQKFVDGMGQDMNYRVAVQDSNFMETDWITATGSKYLGIPASFVINRDGKLAWIGHPKYLEKILPRIIDNTWDIKVALAERNLAQHLKELDDSMNNLLNNYRDNPLKPGDLGKPYEALSMINKIIQNEPKLEYAPLIAYNTFSSLLKTNQVKAYEYGSLAIVTPSYNEEPDYDEIIEAIKIYSDKLPLSKEIYLLGAEAYQSKIDYISYPEIIDIDKYYHKMAGWYWRAKNKLKAIEAEQQAINVLQSKTALSNARLMEYESTLQKYRSSNNW